MRGIRDCIHQIFYHRLACLLRNLTPKLISRPYIRRMKLDRLTIGEMLILNGLNGLGQKISLPFEQGNAC